MLQKKCDINKIHKIQIDFFKNTDYQILFIQRIINQISKNIFLANHHYWKILIYSYLCINIKKTPYVIIKFIKDKVDQYRIFLLLQPEWKPRYEHFLCLTKEEIYSKKLKTRMKYFFKDFTKIYKSVYKTFINLNTTGRFVNNQYIINKINSIKFISQKLKLWLNSQSLTKYNCKILQKQSVNDYFNENILYELLENILNTGIEWHIYINLKIKNVYKNIILISEHKILFIKYSVFSNLDLCVASFIKKIDIDLSCIKYKNEKQLNQVINFADVNISIKTNKKFTLEPSSNSIKLLFHNMRSVLYHKNQIDQWRLNRYLTSDDAKSAIQKELLNWYKHYYHILDSTQISKMHLIADKLFYIWQVKK